MSYESFTAALTSYLSAAPGVKMKFSRRGGTYYAWASTGDKFRGNSIAKRIEAVWASGHPQKG